MLPAADGVKEEEERREKEEEWRNKKEPKRVASSAQQWALRSTLTRGRPELFQGHTNTTRKFSVRALQKVRRGKQQKSRPPPGGGGGNQQEEESQ